jgi:hypothetical protein
MDVLLDETTLHPCAVLAPAPRIQILAQTVRELDGLGLPRVLRCVRAAPDMDLGEGRGLRSWCFDQAVDRDARQLLLSRLGKQPFIDGPDGLFSRREGSGAIDARIGEVRVYGLGLAGLGGGIATGLVCEPASDELLTLAVVLSSLEENEIVAEPVEVMRCVSAGQVRGHGERLRLQLLRAVGSGADLLERAEELFPNLCFGSGAIEQFAALSGKEPVFGAMLRHLDALDEGARQWAEPATYCPAGSIKWSTESLATLKHGRFGPMRDFPPPTGFAPRRFSYHTKLVDGWRLYFHPERTQKSPVVLIGYIGAHLPTVRFDG